MKNYAILRDAIDEKVFGLVIENNGGYQFYGTDERSREWASWANSTSTKSLAGVLPVGVTANRQKPLTNDSESFIEGLIESAANHQIPNRYGISFKGSEVTRANSTTPSARDFQLRAFDISSRKNAVNFKALAFKNDQKTSSLLATMRATGAAFNEKTGDFNPRNIAISRQSLTGYIDETYTKSLQRHVGLNVTSAKKIHAKAQEPFYVHPSVIELKRLGGPIGSRLGRGLRSAPAGMVFVDVTGAIDADKDGIVFEGKPGLERPIIPRFILPEGVGRRVASLISGQAENNEKNRRAGILSGGSIDEGKLKEILGTDAGSLNALTTDVADIADTNIDVPAKRSITGTLRSRRDAIMNRRAGTDNLSRVGRGGKTQINTGDSRAIEKMSWDDDAKELVVTFAGGRTYTYKGVDDSWVNEIESNPDALGRIMNDIKKAGYDFEPGGEHAPDKTLSSRIQGRREAAGMRSSRDEMLPKTTWKGERPGVEDIKSGADLTGADLSEINLSGVDLSNCDLSYADLYNTNLSGANLSKSDLVGVYASRAKLDHADLESSLLDDGVFNNASLVGANLSNVDANMTFFENADLSKANLNRSTLKSASFQNANMSGANISEAKGDFFTDFFGTNLSDADLSGGQFARSRFSDANLTNANLFNADLRQANLRNAIFRNADLNEANLTDAVLDGAILRDANLKDAVLDKGWEQRVGMRSTRTPNYVSRTTREKYAADYINSQQYQDDLQEFLQARPNKTERDYRKHNKFFENLQRFVPYTGDNRDTWTPEEQNTYDYEGWTPEEVEAGLPDLFDRGLESNRSTDARQTSPRFSFDLGSSEDYISSDQYEQDLQAFLEANPRKTERDYRMSRAFVENIAEFRPPSGFEKERDMVGDYEGWTPDEVEAGIPDLLSRGMESNKSTLTPEGERDIKEATKKLSDFAKTSEFGDVYPGAEKFDKSNDRHMAIYDEFADADMPSQRTQDVLNAMQALKEVFGDGSDVGYTDRTVYAIDHIAPTFDARLSLSKGVRKGGPGIESRRGEDAGFIEFALRSGNLRNLPDANDMTNLDLAGADMSNGDFSGMDFTGAKFTGANLSGAIFRDATMPDGQKYNPSIHDSKYKITPPRTGGVESRTARASSTGGFTGRSRTATLERTAIGSPSGMQSAKRSQLYKDANKRPGQEKVSPNDGQLWASLSPADRQLFAKRAKARESQIIEMLQNEFEIPIAGTDRRLDDPTLSAKERAKILKETGGGTPWVIPNSDAPGYHLLNDEGQQALFYGEYSVRRKAKELSQVARKQLEEGNIAEHKKTVAKLKRLLELSDDLETLSGARIQGERDTSLVDKADSYDLAIDHLHPVSKGSIMNVVEKKVDDATNADSSGSKKKSRSSIYEISGADSPFEFKFTRAQTTAKSTAIRIPGRPAGASADYMRQAGVRDEEGNIAAPRKTGRFFEFLREKVTDLSKADEKAKQKRIEKLRKEGKNVGGVVVVEDDKDRPSLLDRAAMKQSRSARKKLLNARPRSVEKLTKGAEENNNSVITMTAKTEDGKQLLTPAGIAALATALSPGEKEWRKHYSNKGGASGQGHALAFIWGATEMNGTPHAVNEEEFKQLLDAGWRPIKRGTGTRQYGIEYMDSPTRYLVGRQGEAYGPGEYWSTGSNTSWGGSTYYPEPDGLKGDGPGGIAGLLPPTAKIVTARELDNIRADHRKFASSVLGHYLGYPDNGWRKEDKDNFVASLTDTVFKNLPRDSEVWDSPIGQMTLQLIQAMESNPSQQEFEKLREALFRLTSMVNQSDNIYAPLFGFDAIDVGSDVMLLMNRAAVTVFADPMHFDAVVSMGKGNGLPPGYVLPAKK